MSCFVVRWYSGSLFWATGLSKEAVQAAPDLELLTLATGLLLGVVACYFRLVGLLPVDSADSHMYLHAYYIYTHMHT